MAKLEVGLAKHGRRRIDRAAERIPSGKGDWGKTLGTVVLAAGSVALAYFATRRARQIAAVAPEFRSPLLMMPISVSSLTRPILRMIASAFTSQAPACVTMREHRVPQANGETNLRVIAFRRETPPDSKPALLWMHGGGYVMGTPEQDMAIIGRILERLDIVIVSVDYRLAPECPFPEALDDCHAALAWLAKHADDLGIDPARIAIGGQSAGGGLAAALVQRAVDQGPITPILQLLMYPMLDALTTARTDHNGAGHFIWTPGSNLFGWRSYLGRDPTSSDQPAYAVPARRADLRGLPPAWIGVGTLDLFHDEDVDYGRRLRQAGVACDTAVIDGAYHGFDALSPDAPGTARFYDSMLKSLERAISPNTPYVGAG